MFLPNKNRQNRWLKHMRASLKFKTPHETYQRPLCDSDGHQKFHRALFSRQKRLAKNQRARPGISHDRRASAQSSPTRDRGREAEYYSESRASRRARIRPIHFKIAAEVTGFNLFSIYDIQFYEQAILLTSRVNRKSKIVNR